MQSTAYNEPKFENIVVDDFLYAGVDRDNTFANLATRNGVASG